MAKRDIDFLFEIGSLRHVSRAWRQVLAGEVQNISEHMFRTAIIGWIIAISEKADANKVIKMCLIHDMAESRTGDIAFIHRSYVTRHDVLAEGHMFQDTVLAKEAALLLKEYNERKSLEARIVKDADNLDVDLELEELAQTGNAIAVDMQKGHRLVVRGKKLYTQTARRMWDEIRKVDSNTWHRGLTNKWLDNSKGAK